MSTCKIADEFGYEMKTTFWDDFSIADVFGMNAIHDTFKRAFKEWKGNYIYLTELAMVLNWKAWQHYQHNEDIASLYSMLWETADNYAKENLKNEELRYYYSTTD